MSQPGQRGTVKHNSAMARRIAEVGRTEDENAVRAYARMAVHGTVYRVVDSAPGTLAIQTQGSRVFTIPASAFVPVKTVKKSANKGASSE